MTDLSHSREKDKINPVVFYTSAGLILLFSLTTILFRDFSALWIGRTLDWVSKTFGWYYLWRQRSILSLWSVSLVRVLVR